MPESKTFPFMKKITVYLLAYLALSACQSGQKYDIIIKNGLIYDGNGGNAYQADVAIKADTIAAIGDLSKENATQIIEAKGMAVTPGFVNMLSQSGESLIQDGRSMSD